MWTMDSRLSRRQALGLLPAWWLASASAAPADLYLGAEHWVDDRGRRFALDSLRGRPGIVTMAYGACRRVCSTSLRVMERIQAVADSRGLQLNFVVLGLDPAEDTPRDWADFRSFRKLDRSNWQFLTGDVQAVGAMASRLGVHYWRYGEHVMHDFRIVLATPDGHVSRVMTSFDEDPATLLPG